MPVRLNFNSAWDREKSLIFRSKFDENLQKNVKIFVLPLGGRSSRRFLKIRKIAKSLAQPYLWRLGLARPSRKKQKIEKTCFWGARARPSCPAGAAARGA